MVHGSLERGGHDDAIALQGVFVCVLLCVLHATEAWSDAPSSRAVTLATAFALAVCMYSTWRIWQVVQRCERILATGATAVAGDVRRHVAADRGYDDGRENHASFGRGMCGVPSEEVTGRPVFGSGLLVSYSGARVARAPHSPPQ